MRPSEGVGSRNLTAEESAGRGKGRALNGFDIGRVLVVGGGGRVGRLLRAAWAREGQGGLIWQHRSGMGDGPRFDPLSDPAGYADAARGADAILNLAGRVGGDATDLVHHSDLAQAALRSAREGGVPRVFIASSAAVYGPTHCAGEDDPLLPASDYGRAKVAMEIAVRNWTARHPAGPAAICLRIGNVAGADRLLGHAGAASPQMLDLFENGKAPVRSYIGPRALARGLGALFAAGRAGRAVPAVLNMALDGAVAMEALLDADGRAWQGRPAPDGGPPEVSLDVTRLGWVIGALPDARAGDIVADLRSLSGHCR